MLTTSLSQQDKSKVPVQEPPRRTTHRPSPEDSLTLKNRGGRNQRPQHVAFEFKYIITELELLAIVETLKEFNGMLWGQRINVYTDHKNLTRDGIGLTSDRVARWRILLEEYAPEIIYIEGNHNAVADAISRLDYDPKLNTTNEYNHATHVKSTKGK